MELTFLKQSNPENELLNTEIEKNVTLVFIQTIQLIYKKHSSAPLDNKTRNAMQGFLQNWLYDEFKYITYIGNPIEGKVKTFLNDFDQNFEKYASLPGFMAINSFGNKEAFEPNPYIRDTQEKIIFDYEKFIEYAADERGKLKTLSEINPLLSTTPIKELQLSLNEYAAMLASKYPEVVDNTQPTLGNRD